MAQITTLKDKDGQTLYPITTTKAVLNKNGVDLDTLLSGKVSEEQGKGLSSNDYTDEDKSKLDLLPTSEGLSRRLNAKQNALRDSQDILVNNDQLSVTEEAKRNLFIDTWNIAWKIGKVTYGKYDPENAPDAEHPFMGNDVWMTYEEALLVLQNHDNTIVGRAVYSNAKTLLPLIGGLNINLQNRFSHLYSVEILRIVDYYIANNAQNPDTSPISIENSRDAFPNCPKLREVRGILSMSQSDAMKQHFYNGFFYTINLEIIWIRGICLNTNLSVLKKLKLECLAYMMEHAANTAAITVTVHPEVYAKLTDEGNAQWHSVLTAALDKNISFATV